MHVDTPTKIDIRLTENCCETGGRFPSKIVI